MKQMFTIMALLVVGSEAQEEATISMVRVHPNSRELLEKSGGTVPDEMAEEYWIFAIRNSGHGKNNNARENKYLTSRFSVLFQTDLTEIREVATSFGSIGVVVSLSGDAQRKLTKSFAEKELQSLGLLIDDNWFFLITGPENIRFEEKEV